jgi:signal transduction histidine kinase
MLIAIASILLSILATVAISYATYKIFDLEDLRDTVHWLYTWFDIFIRRHPWYFIFLFIILLAGGFYYLLTKRTTNRMNAILNAVLKIQKGEYHILLPNDNGDPLGELEQNINLMAIQVNDTLNQRKEIEKSKDDFIVNIAHDLRTPLTSIIGYLSFIGDKQLEPEISAKYARVAFEKSQQLESLVESLFDIAHFTMDTIPINKEELNLKKLLLQKQDELYPQLHAADMEIRLDNISDGVLKIHADGALIARVFDNLINNAIRYAKEGRYIDIEAETNSGKIRISFITHANPIPVDELEKIFDKLYRLEKSRAAGMGGTGLGLSISRRIIELHGGTLAARQLGNGTAFDIYLPML